MTHLTKIHKNTLTNLDSYLSDNSHIELLSKNIEQFEKIDPLQLNQEFKKMPVFDFSINNEVLLVIAESYLHFTRENKEKMSMNDLLALLDKAKACYEMLLKHTRSLPARLVDGLVSDQITAAEYYLHKIKFLKAEIQLLFIKNDQSNGTINLLNQIITDYENFQDTLNNVYKDREYREGFLINDKFLNSIKDGLEEAQKLVAPKLKKRPLRENKEDSPTKNSSTSKKIPKRSEKKAKHEKAAQSEKAETSEKAEKSEQSEEPLELLHILADAIEFSEAEAYDMSDAYETSVVSQPLQNPTVQYKVDSTQYLILLNEGALNKKVSGIESKLIITALSLLYSGLQLKKERSDAQNDKYNPAIHMAIKLFLLVSEKGTSKATEAIEKLKILSNNYGQYLKPFIHLSFFKTDLKSEQYINYLNNQFATNNNVSSPLSFRLLSPEQIIETIFQNLEKMLSEEEYKLVSNSCQRHLTEGLAPFLKNTAPEVLYQQTLTNF